MAFQPQILHFPTRRFSDSPKFRGRGCNCPPATMTPLLPGEHMQVVSAETIQLLEVDIVILNTVYLHCVEKISKIVLVRNSSNYYQLR